MPFLRNADSHADCYAHSNSNSYGYGYGFAQCDSNNHAFRHADSYSTGYTVTADSADSGCAPYTLATYGRGHIPLDSRSTC